MTHLKDHIGYWLSRLRMEVHTTFERRLESHDISVAQWCILLSVYQDDGYSITSLSQYIEIDRASISRVVDRLVAKNLVIHQEGKDRRSGRIELTEEGTNLVPRLIQEAEDNEAQFFGHLSAQEKADLRHIWIKIFKTIPTITLSGWLDEGVNDDVK